MIEFAPSPLIALPEQSRPRGFRAWRDQAKLRLREWQNPLVARRWKGLRADLPVLSECCAIVPRMPYKLYVPYFSTRLSPHCRLDALAVHYRLMDQWGVGGLLLRAARQAVTLGHLPGKSGQAYALRLQACHALMREGELVLQLALDGCMIYAVAFTFMEERGERVLALGCVQGGNSEDAQELVRQATRDLHGLRPKNLLMRVLRDLAARAGCARLVLVGNANRAVTRPIRDGKVFADYDAFWEECGASRRADGDYALAPERAGASDLSEVASKKRAEVRRRDSLAIEASAAVGSALHLD
ncbi:DUF535 family protein [Massilia sp. TS11]|uniref:DUF535 family protein n=1 Tax=Massilia sp. TS11 TaxID=2908003 RepID=UPI001EDAE1C9|nr:VirK/YbjX family protein [Massilia sp. TS11]